MKRTTALALFVALAACAPKAEAPKPEAAAETIAPDVAAAQAAGTADPRIPTVDPASITDAEAQRQWLASNYDMVIGRVGSSPHRTGLAFDLSGAPLSQIEAAVRRCAREKPAEFHFSRLIYESANNCIHVEVTG